MSAEAPPSSIPEVAFVLELGRTLQACGVSAATLEVALGKVARHLDLEGAIYATPTGFLASLRAEGSVGKTYLIRCETGSSSLGRLADAETLVDDLLGGRMDIHAARQALAELTQRPPRFSRWQRAAAHGLAALSAAVIFGGGWLEVALASVLGLLVGVAVTIVAKRRPSLDRLAPALGGVLASLGGAVLGHLVPTASHPHLVISGIIGLVPGLGLLVAMQELGTGHLVAGTARLSGAFLTFLLLAFGIGLGQRLGGAWLVGAAAATQPLPPWALAPAVAGVTWAFLVIFQGRPEDYGWTLAGGALAWTAAFLGTRWLGAEAGAGLAAFALGAACNSVARRTRRPAAALLLPPLMLILPGSLGLRGTALMMQGQTLAGLQAGVQTVLVTVALMLGLFLANALVARRAF